MNIRKYEFRKAVTSPILVALLIIFISFNIFMIYENSYYKEELKVLNKIVRRLGYKIDDQMEVDFGNYYNDEIKKLNEITYEKTGKTYKKVSDFFEGYYSSNYDRVFSENEMEFIKELGITESYYNTLGDIDEIYEKIDPMEIAEAEIAKYRLRDSAADTVRKVYKGFAKRFNELVKNKEHKNLFFIGEIYKMHSLLFQVLFRSFIFEMLILIVLTTSYLINYEFDNNTHLLIYSTKRGRAVILDKLYVAMFVNALVVTIILFTGLGAYFTTFDYSGLWNIPISSYFNKEPNLLYMSWWNMSFIQYLFCSIGLLYICSLLFTVITFVIARFIKNNYIVFSIFAIIFGLTLIIPSIVPTGSNVIFLGGFTPFFLIMNPFLWFMESGAFTTFKYYEIITVGIWSVMLLAFSMICIKGFRRQDIY